MARPARGRGRGGRSTDGRRSRGDLTPALAAAIAAAAGRRPTEPLARIRELGLDVVTVDDPRYPSPAAPRSTCRRTCSTCWAIRPRWTRRPPSPSSGRAGRPTRAGPSRRGSPRTSSSVGACGRVRARGRHRWRGPRGRGRRRRARRSRSSARAMPSLHPRAHSRLADSIVASGGAVVSELGPDIDPSQGHVPAPQPDHQRPGRCDGRGRGAGPERRPDHGLVGARAGTRVLPRARARSMPRRRPAALPSCASSRERDPDRGRASRSSSTTSAWPTTWPSPASSGDAAATLRGCRRGGRPARPRARPRPDDRRRARRGHRLAGGERAGGADPARATRSRGRRPRPVPARRRPRRRGPGDGPPAPTDGALTAASRSPSWRCVRVCPARRPVLPFREVARPQSGPSPALGGSPDHEQERLLRQAVHRAAGRPRLIVAARLAALLRRSTARQGQPRARPGPRRSVSASSAPARPATTVATRTIAIAPLSQSEFTTTVDDRTVP